MPQVNLIFILFSLLKLFNSQYNEAFKPVIGIYGNSNPENNDTFINSTYYPISYIYWLQSVGAEVMAIHYWYPLDVIDEILNKVNGVLFLGGSRNIIKDGVWEMKAKYIMEQSLLNQLPVWGTCQGFQLIGILMSENYTLLRYDFDDYEVLHGLQITEAAKSSKMFKYLSEKDFDILQNRNSAIYFHHFGFYPEEFYNEKRLNDLFIVTSISEDKNGLKFIDTYEGKNDNIKFYATQFHPEKNPFNRYNYEIGYNFDSLFISHKLAMSFIEEARKNKNKFDSLVNNEGDRSQFDFFDTYQGTSNSYFEKESETLFFDKREE